MTLMMITTSIITIGMIARTSGVNLRLEIKMTLMMKSLRKLKRKERKRRRTKADIKYSLLS